MKWELTERQLNDPKQLTIVVQDDKRRHVCELFGSKGPRDPATKRKWARIIAAAPDLLDALQAVLDVGMTRKTVELAVQAVEKATGRESVESVRQE